MKRGPKMSRQLRAEFTLAQVGGRPRQLGLDVLVKLRAAIKRISHSTDPRVQRCLGTMGQKYLEVQV
jgi:hypothetical protein